MARKLIDIGIIGNDGTGDSIRDSFRKVNENFYELYGSLGLGERLSFTNLGDTPDDYEGLSNDNNVTAILTVDDAVNPEGLMFKTIRGGAGITIVYPDESHPEYNSNEIVIEALLSQIQNDRYPKLGGDLSTTSGGTNWRIIDMGTDANPLIPIHNHEAVNKAYADTKVSIDGVNANDPLTGTRNPAFGRMNGPLILSRNPQPDDDIVYDGLIAATKRYVDNSAFGSVQNLYVATSGEDYSIKVARQLQGSNLAYAFRSIGAALQRADELVAMSPIVMGPYSKPLTYQNGEKDATLESITVSPNSGTGFAAKPLMSVDTIELESAGLYYYADDILTLDGGNIATNGQPTRIQVLSTAASPGPITAFKVLSSGVYDSVVPGYDAVTTTTTNSGQPVIGTGATFNVTYKVNNIEITNPGSGYSLVSVRITGAGKNGFGNAVITAGAITDIIIKDTGGQFTEIPTVVADLPRFALKTEGLRTDASGDYSSETEQAHRTRDLYEGRYLKGNTSGALAQILVHSGELDVDGNELFDVDIIAGTFELDESLSYDDVVHSKHVNVIVESGVYYENLPLKVPENVSITGDSFNRIIVEPLEGSSASPWAFQHFRRDLTNDGIDTASVIFGQHYLTDPTQPVYPKINNTGNYTAAATLIDINNTFILEEIVGWVNDRIENNIVPFVGFEYDKDSYKKDINIILDAISYDVKYGEYNRIVSTGLRYYQTEEGIDKITNKLPQVDAIHERLRTIVQTVITNTPLDDSYQNVVLQSIDKAYIIDATVPTVITALFDTLNGVIHDAPELNKPLENKKIDVFLCNDSTAITNIRSQEHGGFMICLDPAGKITIKSPEIDKSISISQSKNKQVFAGGMFIDGFAGNIKFSIESKISDTQLEVSGLQRLPQLPCSFIIAGVPYRVNYIRNFVYNPAGSTANLILDRTTPLTLPLTSPAVDTYELLPPGTRTVVAKDFAQINDMGYGVLATNNSSVEVTGFPTDYCYVSQLALNGSKIKSVSGITAHGVYGLMAAGADPYEVPKPVSLHVDPTQGVRCYNQPGYTNAIDDTVIHVYGYSYQPLAGSELEIKFSNEIYAYAVASVSTVGLPAGVTKLTLAPSDSDGINGLLDAVPHDTLMSLRSKTQLILNGDIAGVATRPSTALRFDHDLDTVYRILQIEEQAPNVSKVTLKENYDYVEMIVTGVPAADQISGSQITEVDIADLIGYKFVFNGVEYIITDADDDSTETILTLDNIIDPIIIGLDTPYSIAMGPVVGDADSIGKININISVTEAVSHNFQDVGTGSYADSNIPPEIYGKPVNAVNAANEVVEKNVGRVFYTSVDQYGNFNVGPYLKVDQGTGQVTFSAAIALSNLDGLGFKRGVTVSEFSIDPTFADNSISAVPTESATRAYIDKRLGIDHDGVALTDAQMIPANTGGFLPLNGQVAMKGNINLQDAANPTTFHQITNLGDPINPRDAVNLQSLTFDTLQGVTLTGVTAGDMLTFNGTGTELINSTLSGDITASLAGNQLQASISTGVITDTNIAAAAGIDQSKLAMNIATAYVSPQAGTPAHIQAASGLSSYNSLIFTVLDGWVTIKDRGIELSKLEYINARTLLGNSSFAPAAVGEVSYDAIINDGGGIKKSQYTGLGFLRRKSSTSNVLDVDYEIVDMSALNDPNTLVKRDVNGDFAGRVIYARELRVDSQVALDTQIIGSGGAIRLYGWDGNGGIMIAGGTDAQDKASYYDNDYHKFRTQSGTSYAPIRAGSVQTTAITTGSEGTAGTIEGDWSLVGNSRLESTYAADLAEYYEGDKEYAVGTVLVFGGEKEVTIGSKYMDTRIAGVVSCDAAFAMYKACPGYKNLIALQGRVPCRVVGKIAKGDLLVTATLPGVAISAKEDAKAGTIIGKALENYDSDHIGTIQVAVGRN